MFKHDLRKERAQRRVYPPLERPPSGRDTGLTTSNENNRLVSIETRYMEFFSEAFTSDDTYEWFVSRSGEIIKDEARTKITLLSQPIANGSQKSLNVFLKEYYFPPLARIRSSLQTPKAEREYRGLKKCREFGIPAVRPIGFGSSYSFKGLLRSCFIMTVALDDTVDYRSWLERLKECGSFDRKANISIMRRLGEHLRALHKELFFLMRPSPKNILLVGAESSNPDPFFVDLAYARFLPSALAIRFGQRVDFGMLFGPFVRWSMEEAVDQFLETYLPDPFGHTPAKLRQFILYAAKIRENRTPLAFALHKANRAIRRGTRMFHRQRHTSGRCRGFKDGQEDSG